MDKKRIKAIILDLDGVITRTAKLHAEAWKIMFDEYSKYRGEHKLSTYEPFDKEEDYRTYVDGKPRYKGVKSYLASKNITLPEGTPKDAPGWDTICALGNKKNVTFTKFLEEGRAEVFEDAVKKIRLWREKGFKTAVVSSSKNCAVIIRAAKIEDQFDVRVDGITAEEIKLTGKPAPDIFLYAAKKLNVKPEEAVVVEDAQSGVQAGRAGKFYLVLGMARYGQDRELRENGADVTVSSFEDIKILPSGEYLIKPKALKKVQRQKGINIFGL